MRPYFIPILVALLVTGCASTKQVPREEFEVVSRKPLRFHRVTMNDGTVYSVARFSVTDSTFVIKELSDADARYPNAVTPIVRPLDSVVILETTDARGEAWGFFVAIGVVIAIAVIGRAFGAGLI